LEQNAIDNEKLLKDLEIKTKAANETAAVVGKETEEA